MKFFTLLLLIFIACESSAENKPNTLPDLSDQQFMHSNHFRFSLEKDGTFGTGWRNPETGELPFFGYRESELKTTFDYHDATNLPYVNGAGLLISAPAYNYSAPNFRTRYGDDNRGYYANHISNGRSTLYHNFNDTIVQIKSIYGNQLGASYEQLFELDTVSFLKKFNSPDTLTKIYVNIRMVTSSLNSELDSNYVIFDYEITNNGKDSILGLYASFLTNFEIEEGRGFYNYELNFSYESFTNSQIHLGLKVLNKDLTGLTFNMRFPSYSETFFEDPYVFTEVKTISTYMVTPNYDISTLTTAEPINLAPKETKVVSFALVGGVSEQDLLVNAKRAQVVYDLAH